MNGRIALALAPLAFAWLWTWRHLAAEWLTHPHYQYGWAVPVLFLVLAWRAWGGEFRPRSFGATEALIAVAGIAIWGLGEAIRLHDPLWRLAGGLLNAGGTLATAAWLMRSGGLPLLRRFTFPLLFTWTAVPWPVPLELALTQKLLQFITTTAVFCATAVGIPALQRANVVELTTGPLGLSDACSGLQSLQAVLMASLFLGGLHRLSAARLLVVICAGGAIALAGNLLRVVVLIGVANRGGPDATEYWHDLAGMCATGAIFLALLAVARGLQGDPTHAIPTKEPVLPPAGANIATLCALVLTAVGLRWNMTISPNSHAAHWRLDAAALPRAWKAEPFTPSSRERALLRYDSGDAWRIRTPEGMTAWYYHFVWSRGGMPPLAFSHTPAMCLPWSGWQPEGDLVRESLKTSSGILPSVRYGFTLDEVQTTAFQIVAVNGQPKHADFLEPNVPNRLARLFSTWRAPREVIDEEILLYVPLPAQTGAATTMASQVLDAVARTR